MRRVLLASPAVLLGVLLPASAALGVCSTNCIRVNDSSDTTHASCDIGGVGTCSLRDAITRSNALQGWSMQFAIGSGLKTINILSNLPDIITRGTIDGTTQPGYAGNPIIEVHRGAGTADHGLRISADGLVTVRALIINHFSGGAAISFESPGSNFVENCWIGLNNAGTAADGNSTGIFVSTGVGGNTIGGLTASKRNVISGNTVGLSIRSTNDNQVVGNWFGTDKTGTVGIPNTTAISITNATSASTGNVIGGDTAAARNVIASGVPAVAAYGVALDECNHNTVKGNYIGTDATGLVPLAVNIGITGTAEDTDTYSNNVIAATGTGIFLGWDGVTRSQHCVIQGNYLGTDSTGNKLISAGNTGVHFALARNNTLGGPLAVQSNVIGGFQYGVQAADSFNTIVGNLIGIGLAGRADPERARWRRGVRSRRQHGRRRRRRGRAELHRLHRAGRAAARPRSRRLGPGRRRQRDPREFDVPQHGQGDRVLPVADGPPVPQRPAGRGQRPAQQLPELADHHGLVDRGKRHPHPGHDQQQAEHALRDRLLRGLPARAPVRLPPGQELPRPLRADDRRAGQRVVRRDVHRAAAASRLPVVHGDRLRPGRHPGRQHVGDVAEESLLRDAQPRAGVRRNGRDAQGTALPERRDREVRRRLRDERRVSER
jgi:hypothetical protein